MWSLVLTTFHTFSSPALLPESTQKLITQQTTKQNVYHHPSLQIAQTSNVVEASSPLGYSLKYSSDWQRFNSSSSDPNFDIFIRRSFSTSQVAFWVTITTTVMEYIGVPKEVPESVKKIDLSAKIYAEILAQSGYKINDIKEMMIGERKAVRLVTETPQKAGSIIVLVEGKEDTMIVSTSFYPINSSAISQALIDEVVEEIELVQNSITIRED